MEHLFNNLFNPSAIFHIETSDSICSADQTTGFYMKWNTKPKCVNSLQSFDHESLK